MNFSNNREVFLNIALEEQIEEKGWQNTLINLSLFFDNYDYASKQKLFGCSDIIREEWEKLEDYSQEAIYQQLFELSLCSVRFPCPNNIRKWLKNLGYPFPSDYFPMS